MEHPLAPQIAHCSKQLPNYLRDLLLRYLCLLDSILQGSVAGDGLFEEDEAVILLVLIVDELDVYVF